MCFFAVTLDITRTGAVVRDGFAIFHLKLIDIAWYNQRVKKLENH